MATIRVERPHALGLPRARALAEELARALAARAGIEWRWEGDRMSLAAPSGPARGTRGRVRVEPSAVRVEVELPLLLRALRGPVEERLTQKLDSLLAA